MCVCVFNLCLFLFCFVTVVVGDGWVLFVCLFVFFVVVSVRIFPKLYG